VTARVTPEQAAISLKPFLGKQVRIVADGTSHNTELVVVGHLYAVGLRLDQKRPYEAVIVDDANRYLMVNVTRIRSVTEWTDTPERGDHLTEFDLDTGAKTCPVYTGNVNRGPRGA